MRMVSSSALSWNGNAKTSIDFYYSVINVSVKAGLINDDFLLNSSLLCYRHPTFEVPLH